METWRILTDVVFLLAASALLGGLSERLGQSAVVGYLIAGALLGPRGLHVVEDSEEVLALSEIGVALLLFVIGLEFSWQRLRGMGPAALGGGALQVAATLTAGGLTAYAAGFAPGTAVLLGAVLALSSTACVMRLLSARGEIASERADRSVGVLLVQDVAVVPLVLLVSVLAEGGSPQPTIARLGHALGFAVALVAALYLVFARIVPQLLAAQSVRTNRELALLVAVVSGLGSGVAAHAAGLSPALGAFVAGLVLAESPFALQVRAEVSGLKTLLLTLFFSSVGMLSDPSWIAGHAGLVAGAVAGAIVLKALLGWMALRTFGVHGPVALATSIGLAQVGEFSFVLAGVGRGSLLTEDTFALIVSTTLLTMLATPLLVGYAPNLARLWFRKAPRREEAPAAEASAPHIVVGFGPSGREVAQRLAASGARVVVIDHNPAAAREARELGYSALTGDSRYAEVLEHAGLDGARLVVVTLPDTSAAQAVTHYVRQHAPWALLVARSRHQRAVAGLQSAGAHAVIDEEREVGARLAEACEQMLLTCGPQDGPIPSLEENPTWTGA